MNLEFFLSITFDVVENNSYASIKRLIKDQLPYYSEITFVLVEYSSFAFFEWLINDFLSHCYELLLPVIFVIENKPFYFLVPGIYSLQWCHNERGGVSNHQPHDCLLNCLFSRRSKKTWKLRVTGLCERNSLVTGEFPIQRASKAENVSIWWRHHVMMDYDVQKFYPSMCESVPRLNIKDGLSRYGNFHHKDKTVVLSL